MALYGLTPRYSESLKNVCLYEELGAKDVRHIIHRYTKEAYSKVIFRSNSGSVFQSEWHLGMNRNNKLKACEYIFTNIQTGESIINTSLNEHLELVENKVGLNFDQFKRAVMLAQNEFSQFLKANANDKASMLEKLTGTAIYSTISQGVFLQFQELKNTMQSFQTQIQQFELIENDAFDNLKENHQKKEKEQLTLVNSNQELTLFLNSLKKDAEKLKDTESKFSDVGSQKEKQANLLKLFNEESVESQNQLQLFEKALEESKTEIEQARRLDNELQTHEELLANKTKKESDLKETKQKAKNIVDKATHDSLIIQKSYDELVEKYQKLQPYEMVFTNWSLVESNIESYLEIEIPYQSIIEKLNNYHSQYTKAQEELQNVRAYLVENQSKEDALKHDLICVEQSLKNYDLDLLIKNIDKKTSEIQHNEKVLDGLTHYLDLHSKKKKFLEDYNTFKKAYDAILEKLKTQQESLGKQQINFDKKQQEYNVQSRFTDKVVVQLREQLVDGEACPVCGNTQHVNHSDIGEVMQGELAKLSSEISQMQEALKSEIELEKLCLQKSQIESFKMTDCKKRIDEIDVELEQIKENLPLDTYNESTVVDIQAHIKQLTQEYQTLKLQRETILEQQKQRDLYKKQLENYQCDVYQNKLERLNQQLKDILALKKEKNEDKKRLHSQKINLLNKLSSYFPEDYPLQAKLENQDEEWYSILKNNALAFSQKEEKLNGLILQKEEQKQVIDQQKPIIDQLQQLLNVESSELKTLQSKKEALQKKRTPLLFGQSVEVYLEKQANDYTFYKNEFSRKQNQCSTQKEQLDVLEGSYTTLKEQIDILKQKKDQEVVNSHTIESVRLKKQESDTELERVELEYKTFQNQFSIEQDKRKRCAHIQSKIEALESDYLDWKGLNDFIGSSDGKKFRNIAQLFTFRVLIKHANVQLRQLTRRYSLDINSTKKELYGLSIQDHQMGDATRPIGSLSGGETFLVSLGLALGLASLTSHQLQIGSLFIDEGFGSLDAETLNITMTALENLQSQGRQVGVISHVGELSEKIRTQIQVYKQANGSSNLKIVSSNA
ncbi:hypothetical protein N9251_01860 [Gammaproteobacteria bacterium]|nr:hypothetical protein [Gammaproteobacteria bacterium]